MTEWTPEAKQRLDDYLNHVDRLSRSMGDDATEIVEGLRAHITTEAEAHSGTLVTLEHLEQTLSATGTPQQVLGLAGARDNIPQREPGRLVQEIAKEHGEKRLTKDYSDSKRTFVLFFGILLPAFALLVEFFGGIMAGMYLDPIPTIWHVLAGILLLVSLAVGDLTIARLVYGKTIRWPKLVLFLNAYATTLATVYFIVYAPMLPISTVMIIALGGGLLGFAPLFCMLSGLYHMRLLHRLIPDETVPRKLARKSSWAGVLVVLALTVAYGGPTLWVKHLIRQAVSEDASEREYAVGWIRTLHLDGTVLEACYQIPGRGPFRDDSGWDAEWVADRAAYHELYYRLTGKSHRSVPRPELPGNSPFAGRVASDEELMESWNDIGGTEVAGRARGLRLKGSAIDANVAAFNADGTGPALAYIEWILEFRNTDDWEKEARAHIEMPPGGVPSRLTLLIDGEERDAAYGTRQQTRDAYQKVVQRRRDPALLNVVGPDVAMLQCYPVPPAGTMKVKVGITAPLIVRGGKSYLRLPYISECNFTIDAKTEHAVWVEFPAGMGGRAEGLVQEPGQEGLMGLRGKLTEKALQNPASATLEFAYTNADGQTFTGELNGTRAQAIPHSVSSPSIRKVCFVLDGSVFMDKADIDWGRVIQALAGKSEVTAVFAGQKVETYSETFVA
ncbi:MAG: VIT domain-containing protein, partial [Candidatus Hydrogenedentales bacterium]